MVMPILKSFTFTNLPIRSHDSVANRRAKLVSRLEEQWHLIQNPSYVRVVQRWTGKGDERRQVEKKQPVRPWWRTDLGRQRRAVRLLPHQADRVREGCLRGRSRRPHFPGPCHLAALAGLPAHRPQCGHLTRRALATAAPRRPRSLITARSPKCVSLDSR
jgi:hypothetical protein